MSQVIKNIANIASVISIVQQLPQVKCKVNHHFSGGVYVREMLIPKGTIAIGKIHKTDHLNIVTMGEMLLCTALRKLHITAPYTFETKAGEQKIACALQDTVIVNTIRTDSLNPEEIESEVVCTEYNDNLTKQLNSIYKELLCHSE